MNMKHLEQGTARYAGVLNNREGLVWLPSKEAEASPLLGVMISGRSVSSLSLRFPSCKIKGTGSGLFPVLSSSCDRARHSAMALGFPGAPVVLGHR